MAIDIIARGMIEESYGDISHLSEQIDSHTGNGNIHVTTTDKSNWNGYAAEIEQNKTDILNNKNDISQLFDITKGGETVTGESSYTLTDAVDYPLLGLNLYGKSVQDGTPTPENPVDIVSVGDSGSVEVRADNGEKSTSATITSALPLCGIPVESGGNYTDSNGQQWVCDELIYNADGTGKIIKRTATIMLDGSDDESYQLGSATDIYAPFSVLNVVSPVAYTMQIKSNVTDKVNMTQATADSFAIHCGISLNILFGIDMGVTTIEGARAWLSSHHTTIIYPLATPQEIKLTAAEMTALSQLHTYSGITNIFNSGGADMDVKFCTNKMLSECALPITTGLQKQIDELQAAILSLGSNV